MNMIEQYDQVAVLVDMPEENLRRGCVGVVIENITRMLLRLSLVIGVQASITQWWF